MSLEDQIIQAIRDGRHAPRDIAEWTGANHKHVVGALDRLLHAGKLTETWGHYFLAPA